MPSILRELFRFLKARKKYWLLPILVVLGLAKGSAVAPFIYAIF